MRRVVLDGRMLRHDRAGIGRYIWRLQEALGRLPHAELDLALLVDRRGALPGQPSLRARAVVAPVRSKLERVLLPPVLRGIDLVHFPDHGIPPGVHRPAVVTVHDVSFLSHPETHSASSRRHYSSAIRSVTNARAIIAVSRHVKSKLVERDLVDASRVTVVPEAPGLSVGADPGRGRIWSAPYALMVGTVQPRKNIELAARSFGQSKFSREGALLIAGSLGYCGSEIIRTVHGATNDRSVRFLGRVSDDTLAQLLAHAEFLLMPSRDEGFGLPALEAMACGTPVIAARAGTLPEVVGDDGVLVDPDDPDALTAAIDHLAEDTALRSSLGAAGRARAATFSWDRTALDTLAVYEACA